MERYDWKMTHYRSHLTITWPDKKRDHNCPVLCWQATSADLSATRLKGKISFITVCQQPSETFNLVFYLNEKTIKKYMFSGGGGDGDPLLKQKY